jgi:hypothetical protein
MAPEAKKAWQEAAEQCPTGVLYDSDRIALELTATLLSEFRADPGNMPTSRPGRLHSLLAALGAHRATGAGLSR